MNVQQRIVTEDDVDKALCFLRDNAMAIGQAKARLVKAEKMLGHIEALEFQASDASSAEKKKAEARTSEAYLDGINELALASGEYEKMKSLREAAAMKIEAWRSESATYRSMKL